MANIKKRIGPVATPELNELKAIADDLIIKNDIILNKLEVNLMGGHIYLWGTPENPRSLEEVLKILNFYPKEFEQIFENQSLLVQFLHSNDIIEFEGWEMNTPYKVIFQKNGTIKLGKQLHDSWKIEKEKK